MKRLAPLIGLMLLLPGCVREFDANQDRIRVADCYAAFISVGMEADDPALGFSEEERRNRKIVGLQGINRLAPYTANALKAVGGDDEFLKLVAIWRLKPENTVTRAEGTPAKEANYKRILTTADECNDTLTRWGAPPDAGIIVPTAP